MFYDYEYMNNVRIKIWQNEIPIGQCETIKTIRRQYKINVQKIDTDSMVIELKIPSNNSNYGMLGVKYKCDTSGTNILIKVNKYEEELYEDNMSIAPDIVHKGIPEDYVMGILKSIDNNRNKLLRCGTYEFCIGAHGEVGSSEKIFYILTNIILILLCRQEIEKDAVEEIISSQIYHVL